MKQEIIKFQHEEYHTIIHKSSTPIDYKEPQVIPTDTWLDDLFGGDNRPEERPDSRYSDKRPLFLVDTIHNEEKTYVENYGNPICTVRKEYVMVVIERDEDKIAMKLFYGGKIRTKGTKYFQVKKNVEYITVNVKTGDVYSGYLKGFQKKRNYSKKIRRNYFMESSLDGMKSKIRNYLNLYKIENSASIATDLVNRFIDEIDKNRYEDLTIDDRLFKFYLDKRGVKYPNNFGAYKNHLIGPSIRKKLKKNGGKLVDAFMDEFKLQGKILKKSLHECKRLNLETYNYAKEMFGDDRLNQDHGVIVSLLETINHVNNQQSGISLKELMVNSELDRYYKAFKEVFVNLNMDTYTLADHVRMYLELRRYGLEVKWMTDGTDRDTFHNEHLDWTDKLSHYKNGTYNRIYPEILHKLLSKKIGDCLPVLLTTSEEYNEESLTQSNCVKGYVSRPASIIISLRDGNDRATIEYQVSQPLDNLNIKRVQSLGKFNKSLSSDWEEVLLNLDKIMLYFIKDKNFELVKVIKENGLRMKIESGSEWVTNAWGGTTLTWNNPGINNNNHFGGLFN
jgi:hypothetical protein